MAQVINTNIQSLIAQKNLFKSGSSLSTSIERLSSGLRINSAKDDAAGLAISERMSAQIRGMEVAKRNANDGISALQVADGALASVGDNLQRMRELAVQSSNGTLSASDRENLNLEFQQLSQEIARVAGGAEFNGVSLLSGDGMGGPKQFELQIGFSSDSQLNINFENISSEIDSFQFGSSNAIATNASSNDLSLADLGAAAEFSVVDANGQTKAAGAMLEVGDTLTVNGEEFKVEAGVMANTLSLNGGPDIADTTTDGDVTLEALGFTDVSAGDFAAGETTVISNGTTELRLTSDGTDFTDVAAATRISGTNGSAAQMSLDKIDELLDTVNAQRATLGAGINRLDAVISNLETSVVNLSAARGRIVDADFARETANLTRTQILQQAGTAMLAQANQLPTNVLSLLG